MRRRSDLGEADFRRWIEPLLERAAAYAYAMVRNREDAEDAIQEAALKGYLHFHTFDRSRSFKGWWLTIVRNCCRDLARRRRARPSTVPVNEAEVPSPPQPHVRHHEDLHAALQQLSPPHREILELRYFGDCSYREIAASLGIPEGTVMSRLHAARQSLAAIYRRVAE